MSKRIFPSDLVEQALSIQDAWNRIDDQMTFHNLGIAQLVMDINNLRQAEADLLGLENQLTDVRNRRLALQQSTWDKIKRIRAGIKAYFGDDSPQYELVGGTRLSERKSPRRTAVPAEPVQE
jgi:hypothetical protein